VRPDVVPVDLNCRQSTRIAVYCNGQPVLDEACPMEDRRFECPRATEVDVCCSSDPTVPCGQAGLAGENIRLTIENGLQEAVCGGPQMGEWRTCSGRLYRPIEIRCELFP
jgi:hypothetical protein